MNGDNSYRENTYFNGRAGDGDGGFESPLPPQAGSVKKTSVLAVRPVTIRMINAAKQIHSDTELLIDGAPAGTVTIVAKVLEIDRTDTNWRYTLEDSTDQIVARYWIDSAQSNIEDGDDIVEDIYVRVIGAIKIFHDKRQLNAATVRKITDYHEVVGHCMDVIASHLQYTRGPPSSTGGIPTGSNVGPYSVSTALATQVASAQRYAALPPTQRAICEFLQAHPGHNSGGADIKTIVHGIAPVTDATSVDISEALDALMEQGLIFQTKSETMYDLII